MRPLTAPLQTQGGGLPLGAVRRINDYIDAHLGENIGLPELAGIAGLSLFHFARQFKNTTGLSPHHYLVGKRIERAQELLANSDLSLAEIAFATGFADQSHLTRHFHQIVGTTPGQFRRSRH